MPTNLATITPALLALIDAAPGAWKRVTDIGPVTAMEAEGHYRALPDGGPEVVGTTGIHGEQTLAQAFVVTLHREMGGDPHIEEPAFLDAARPVADAIEGHDAWPAGVSCVRVTQRGGIERGYDGASEQFARINIIIRVEYEAPFNGMEV